mmetsp:Transcript_37281/g.68521  ORF Transcript_37281/g.68521 Transcript_37281/m.68521 type:complete len:81 (-) Transcript_37281:290-532(-)
MEDYDKVIRRRERTIPFDVDCLFVMTKNMEDALNVVVDSLIDSFVHHDVAFRKSAPLFVVGISFVAGFDIDAIFVAPGEK